MCFLAPGLAFSRCAGLFWPLYAFHFHSSQFLVLFSATASSICEVSSCRISTLLASSLSSLCCFFASTLSLCCLSSLLLLTVGVGTSIFLTFFLAFLGPILEIKSRKRFEKTKAYQLATKIYICVLNPKLNCKKTKPPSQRYQM